MPIAALQMTATPTDYLGEPSAALGKIIAEINLRARTGAAVITIVRNGKPTTILSAFCRRPLTCRKVQSGHPGSWQGAFFPKRAWPKPRLMGVSIFLHGFFEIGGAAVERDSIGHRQVPVSFTACKEA